MKKLVLSLSIIVLFGVYSIFQRRIGLDTIALSPIISSNNPQNNVASNNAANAGNGYKDGQYTGDVADAYYGNIQVKTIIQNGKIVDVQFLQYPNDRRNSIMINLQAMPILKQEAIQAQNTQVDIVSGATDSSQAFITSLGSALAQAK